ncbi:MAG: putative signal transduction protein with EAL and GGDEF domain [Gammaproteobacteria bacterium]
MKLLKKLISTVFPFTVIVVIVQAICIFLYLSAIDGVEVAPNESLSEPVIFEIVLVGLIFSLLAIGLLAFVLVQSFNKYFDKSFVFINAYIKSIGDGHAPPKFLGVAPIEEVVDVVASLEEMRKTVNIYQKSMEKLAYYDKLTGLPNREFLQQELKMMISSAKRRKTHFAVMYLDLDEFKIINDSLGHGVGDLVLAEVSKRLQELLRGSDVINCKKQSDSDESVESTKGVVARLAGDEFTLLLGDIEDPSDVSIIAERILVRMSDSFVLQQHDITVSASVGIAIYPQDGDDEVSLLRHADYAMLESKKQGKNLFTYYTDEMNVVASRRMKMEKNIREALQNKEFILHFHPRIEPHSRKVVGLEALIRWHHPELGFIVPDQFIPLAEETILICEIGNWVFESVCLQIRHLIDNGYPDVRVSINLSTMQIHRGDTLNILKTYMKLYDISGKNLELEVTEAGMLKDEKVAVDLLNQFRELDISIALDEFGTGYSSISFLQKLPIDVLKIDRCFISDSKENDSDRQLFESVVGIAKNLNLVTVANGVEDEQQLAFIKEVKCDYVQGYCYSEPIPSGDILQFMQFWK